MDELSGHWVNTAYNGGPMRAVLTWANDGTVTGYRASFDTRPADSRRFVVLDAWTEAGSSYYSLASVASLMSGVELRATHQVIRVSGDGNVMEVLAVSASPLPRSISVDPRNGSYRIYYRERIGD